MRVEDNRVANKLSGKLIRAVSFPQGREIRLQIARLERKRK